MVTICIIGETTDIQVHNYPATLSGSHGTYAYWAINYANAVLLLV